MIKIKKSIMRVIDHIEKNLLNENHPLYSIIKNNPPSWWDKVKNDKELYIDIRKDNYLDIYFKGGCMAKIKYDKRSKSLSITAHPKYLGYYETSNSEHYNQRVKDGKTIHEPIYQNCELWLNEKLEDLKQNIKENYSEKKAGQDPSEKSIQGNIIVNNRELYLDSEFAHRLYVGERKTIRIDLVKIEKNKITFVELKRICDSRLHTSKAEDPEIVDQMTDYQKFLMENKGGLEAYYKTLYKIKKTLGLPIPNIDDINNVTVDTTPHLLIAINNYNRNEPRKKKRILEIEDVLKNHKIEYSLKQI